MGAIDVQSLAPGFVRPHVVILGAGASRAACPNGDARGRVLPVMDDLTDALGLREILAKYAIEPPSGNFEALYSALARSGEHAECVNELEERMFDYFADLRLPAEPTVYDRLVLSLRSKDLVATFNWDPLLWQALCRNGRGLGCPDVPRAVYLHGSVAVGYCTKHTPISQGGRGRRCRQCDARLEPSRLLYPVEKHYTDDPGIATSWREVQNDLNDAFLLTIFGYGAPETDLEAVNLMKGAWAGRDDSVLHDVEIIDIRNEDDLVRSWEPFISRDYYRIHSTFSDSFLNRYPRRTGEVMLAQNIDCEFVHENRPPADANFSQLWAWHRPLIEQERVCAPPEVGRTESGHGG